MTFSGQTMNDISKFTLSVYIHYQWLGACIGVIYEWKVTSNIEKILII